MTEHTTARQLAAPRVYERRIILLLLLISLGLIFLLINFAGSQKTFDLIGGADPRFVAAIVAAQALRYAGSTWSTQVLAKIFGQHIPALPLYQTMMAGQALNRTFSVGGVAGVFVRYSFLTRQGLHSGAFAALILVEDIIGAIAISLVFATGLVTVVITHAFPQFAWLIVAGFGVGILLLATAAAYLYHRRDLVERIVHALARAFNAAISRVIGKSLYQREHVQLAIDEFYSGVAHARHDPLRLFAAFLFNLFRIGCDAASLYLAFLALGFAVAPGLLLMMFTSSSALSTLSGVPAEIGVMETALAVVSTSLGIPPPVAVGAILLFRALSYWLPIPVGYAAFWNLQRRGFI